MRPREGLWWVLPASFRVCLWLTLCAVPSFGTAQSPALSQLDPLLALFEASYTTPDGLRSEAAGLAAVAKSQELALLPSFFFNERLAWDGVGGLELSLGLGIDLPLFHSRAAPTAVLQAQREAALAARGAATATADRAQLVLTTLSLALTQELEQDAATASARFAAEVWVPPTNLADALHVAPQDRELLGLYRNVVGLAEFAAGHSADLRRDLERALGAAASELPVPSFGATVAALDLTPPTLDACLASAPEADAARQRHEQRLLGLVLERTTELELSLFGDVAYQVGTPGIGASNGAQAQLGAALRVAVPDGWPVSGEFGARAHLGGAEQNLNLNWPPVSRSLAPQDHSSAVAEADATLTAELAQLKAEAGSLLRAYAGAAVNAQDAEARLLWLTLDVHPDATDLASASALAALPFPDPVIDLHAVTYRADLAFARLGLVTQLIELQVLCGWGELGAWHADAARP